MMAAQASSTETAVAAGTQGTSVGWAGGALLLTSILGIVAKIAGVIVAPGLRGIASQRTVDLAETASATLAYLLAGLLVALVCGGSFELARARRVGIVSRGIVVALSGLVVALASPAVVTRLPVLAALLLAVVTSALALVAGVVSARSAQTRAVGAVLALLAVSGFLRPLAWAANAVGSERASLAIFTAGTALAAAAIVGQGLATLLASVWLGARSVFRGRVLANAALVGACAVTYLAVRASDDAPTATLAVLRTSIGEASGIPLPFGFAAVGSFLGVASINLASVALLQRTKPETVLAPLALALLSGGAFDVPLQALAVVAASHWVMLSVGDERAMWAALARKRGERQGDAPAGGRA